MFIRLNRWIKKRSNCLAFSWSEFRHGKGSHFAVKLSEHRFLCHYVNQPWYRPIAWVGHTGLFLCTIPWMFFFVLAFGKPPHTQIGWGLTDGREYVPRDGEQFDKDKALPVVWSMLKAIVFEGYERPTRVDERKRGSKIIEDGAE